MVKSPRQKALCQPQNTMQKQMTGGTTDGGRRLTVVRCGSVPSQTLLTLMIGAKCKMNEMNNKKKKQSMIICWYVCVSVVLRYRDPPPNRMGAHDPGNTTTEIRLFETYFSKLDL